MPDDTPRPPGPAGVRLGPDSPLLRQTRRRLAPSESDLQVALLRLLVGPARSGGARAAGDGMTTRYPELLDLYAINPNPGGARSKAAAGRAKGMGLLAGMPDLCLPHARGPFHSLYVELKRPGEYGTPEQRRQARRLREAGHCVVECQGVEEAVQVIVGYLALAPFDEYLAQHAGPLSFWREEWHERLTPKRR